MARRRLILLRHAKSSWAEEGLADFDRPLEARGRRAADWIGEQMAERAIAPDHIVCSTARRARETLAAILPHLAGEPKIRLTRSLYESASDDYAAIVAACGGTAQCLMIVGHNPAMAATFERFATTGDRRLIRRLRLKYPTAGLAMIDFDEMEWGAAAGATGRLAGFLDPRTAFSDEDGD